MGGERAAAVQERELDEKAAAHYDAAELFHELLDYRWRLSEALGSDVDLSDAVDSYVEEVLRNVPDERTAIVTEARDGGPEL